MELLFISIIKFLYFAFNSIRVLSYIPQIMSVAKEKSSANAISLMTWWFWTGANITTALYALIVLKDNMLYWMSLGNSVGCLTVILIVLYKRYQYANGSKPRIDLWNFNDKIKPRKKQLDLFV